MSVFKSTATASAPTTGGGKECEVMNGFAIRETAGAAARVRIFNGSFPAPGACAAADHADAGVVTAGVHFFTVTYYTEDGETELSAPSPGLNAAGLKKVAVTAIPTFAGPMSERVTGRHLYMTEAAGGTYYRVATITDNTTTTATVNVNDAALVALPAAPTANLSGTLIFDATLAANETRMEILPVPLSGHRLRCEQVSGAATTLIYGK